MCEREGDREGKSEREREGEDREREREREIGGCGGGTEHNTSTINVAQ